MLIDYRRILSPEERAHLDKIKEVLKSIEPQVHNLLAEHRKTRKPWSPHEVLPWGVGKDFNEIPWDQFQCTLRPEVVLALETNLLTEDNLPYYHAQIAEMVDPDSVWQDWNRLWTSEEAVHAATMRDYLYLMRVMDPREIQRGWQAIMEAGFDRDFADPLEVFAYTSAQELATRISHLRTGQMADEPNALKLLNFIARDENYHYVFYRSVVKAVLEIAPEIMLPAIMNQFYSFAMPGTGMTNFEFRQASIANAGIYGAREHRDLVMIPVIKYWEIDKLTGLTPAGQKTQERILRLEKVLDRMVERQERQQKKTD